MKRYALVVILALGCGTDVEPKSQTRGCPDTFTPADACNSLWASGPQIGSCHACEYTAEYCHDASQWGVWWMGYSHDGELIPIFMSNGDRSDCYDDASCEQLCESSFRYPARCFDQADCGEPSAVFPP